LLGISVQAKEALPDFFRFGVRARLAAAHLAFAEAFHAMRIDRQQSALEMMIDPPQFAQGDLKLLGIGDRASFQQIVNRLIGGDKRKAVGQFESLLRKRTIMAQVAQAKSRFVNQMQSQAWFHGLGRCRRPRAEQVPCAQAQMLGD
jgi:hypothetical protein